MLSDKGAIVSKVFWIRGLEILHERGQIQVYLDPT